MLPALLIPVAIELAKSVPSLLKLFGQDQPAAVVEKVVAVAQEMTGESDPAKAIDAIKADPVKFEEFKERAEIRANEIIYAHLQDTQSARTRDTELHKAGYVNSRGNYLAIMAYAMVILIFIAVLSIPLDEWVKGIIILLLGRFLGYIDQIYNFEFGTTRASKQKDDTITTLSKG